MKRTLTKFISILSLLFSIPVKGDDLIIKYGLGFNHMDFLSGESKFVSIAYQRTPKWFQLGVEKYEVGFWTDSRPDLGRTGAAFGGYSVGVAPQFGAFYVESLWGLSLMSGPDTVLGGPLQFMYDFGMGLKDSKGVSIGFSYKHFSSAGLENPNLGRDFLLFRVGFPF